MRVSGHVCVFVCVSFFSYVPTVVYTVHVMNILLWMHRTARWIVGKVKEVETDFTIFIMCNHGRTRSAICAIYLASALFDIHPDETKRALSTSQCEVDRQNRFLGVYQYLKAQHEGSIARHTPWKVYVVALCETPKRSMRSDVQNDSKGIVFPGK